jgi:hypothetical protein
VPGTFSAVDVLQWRATADLMGRDFRTGEKMTMKKIISLIVFSVFATTAFAQISLDSPSMERNKNARGARAKKVRKAKRRGH